MKTRLAAASQKKIMKYAMMPMGMPKAQTSEPEFCWDGC